jgi:hypothetical protein
MSMRASSPIRNATHAEKAADADRHSIDLAVAESAVNVQFTVKDSKKYAQVACAPGVHTLLAAPADNGIKGNFRFNDNFATAQESASISKTKAGWVVGRGLHQ